MDHPLTLSVQNATGSLPSVLFEPCGREFFLAVDEKLVIAALAGPDGPELRVVESGNRTLVFAAGCHEVRVIKGGESHDLEPIVEATASQVPFSRRTEAPSWDRDLDGSPRRVGTIHHIWM